jgi:cation diffusion facilitator CzcD-associated flavoprotein CzcO
LYTPETRKPGSVPSVDAFTFDPPLPGSPPTFLSPMYTNLWANTPRDIMTFAEKDFPEGTPVFPFRKQILQYLKEYGESVRHLVEFNTEVLKVEKHRKWTVTTRSTKDPSKISKHQFDAIAIASGQTKFCMD